MAKNFEHLIHKNSNVVVDGTPKLPTSSQIEYGELAVNYAKDKETISLKNANNEIVTFSSDVQIQSFFKETEEIIANALNDINARLGSVNELVEENELVTAAALNDINARLGEGSGDISEEIEELITNFEELSLGTATALNDLNSRITTLTSDVDEIELGAASALNDLNERIGEIGNDMEQMDLVTSTALNDLDGRVVNLEEDVETVAEELESDVDEINTRLTTLENAPSGDANVIETVKVNGTALVPDANKAVNVTVPTETTVSGWGFTKNTGTVTGVKMNGTTNNPTNGVVDLGTVITSHQDISGKADKSAAIGSLSLSMDSTTNKITLSGTKVDGTAFTVSDVIDLPLESVVEAITNNTINGSSLNDGTSYWYGTSTTAAATVQKEVSIPSIKTLNPGQVIIVKPTATSTVANSTLKLNNFDAYPMRYNNAAITTSTDSVVWSAAFPTWWLFDGTYWVFVGHGVDLNTTYSVIQQADIETGTATTGRLVSAKVLRDNFYTETEVDTAISGKADKSAAIGSLSLSMDSTNYQITLSGTKVDGTAFTVSNVIDLPLESVVVGGSYNDTTKKVVLTLQNGSTVEFSVADLVAGLQSEITSTNKLSADLISDGTTNKTVTATEKSTWNGKQDALSNATVLSGITSTKVSNWDSAATNSHTHSNKSVLDGISSTDITNWNSKTDNVGTVTGVKMNGATKNPTNGVVDLGTVITTQTKLSKVINISDTGNAVTDISVNDHQITLIKDKTFLERETQLSKGRTTGTGNAVTDITVRDHEITLTKGITFLTSHQSIKTLNGTALTGTGDITLTGVPAFSASDNGKILGVVNGALAWVTPSTIYTGTGTPSSTQGNDGDIYLQTS